MPKTSNVFARVEPVLKEQAEAVLNEIGLPMSNAITLFLKQLVFRRGIPFAIVLPPALPPSLDELTPELFDAELEKGFRDIGEGRVRPASAFFNEMEKKYQP
jgi:addiction module RelB/DinJ family antitoxin